MAEANLTKGALAQSMKKLMSERSFAKISITDICDGCGMNRKSFYYHFKDKYDLMNWIFYSDFIAMIGSESFEDGWALIESVCNLFYESQGFYRCALRTEGQNSFSEYLLESTQPIVEFLFEDTWGVEQTRGLLGKMFCEFYILVVKNWMEQGCKMPPSELIVSIKGMIKKIAAGIED